MKFIPVILNHSGRDPLIWFSDKDLQAIDDESMKEDESSHIAVTLAR
jgi:hypothetical protein